MNKNETRLPFRPAQRQHGFTLVEASVALLIMSLLLGGTITLYIAALRNSGAVSTQVAATLDASGAIQYIMVTAREAMSVALPSDTTALAGTPAWAPPTGTTSSYLSSGVATGIQLTFADAATSAATTAAVLGSTGAQISPAPKVYDHNSTTSGQTVWIYRSDVSGTPSPTTGQYLHMKTETASGTYLDMNIAQMVLTTSTNAVAFTRPSGSITELSVALVSGGYSPISGQETNENSSGITVPLSGQCVLMRNHKVSS